MDAWTDGRSVALSVAVGRSVEDLTASSPMRAISLRIWRSLSGRGSGQRAHHAPPVELTLTCERARPPRVRETRVLLFSSLLDSTDQEKCIVLFRSWHGGTALHPSSPPLSFCPLAGPKTASLLRPDLWAPERGD